MNPTNYDHRMMQQMASTPRQYVPPQQSSSSSSNGGGSYPKQRFVQMPRGTPSQQMYQDDGFDQWDDSISHMGSGGGGGGNGTHGSSSSQAEKPTGLRHFSTKVCEKVKEKGLTNYNEVADELVADYFQNNIMKQIDVVKQEYDMKNIRRRVYDALNVLLAMNIITKNKKDIRWIGLPASATQEISRLEEEKARREASIRTKKEALQEMIMQIVSYKNLIARNRSNEHQNGRPDNDSLLHLPFLIINTDKDTNVECSVSSDKSEFLFSFDKRFEIHDDFEVLKKLDLACGLDTGTSTDEQIKKAKSYLPSLHKKYVDDIIETQKLLKEEKEERRKQMLLMAAQEQIHQQNQQIQQEQQIQYYDDQGMEQQQQQSIQNSGSRFNRQLQEHLIDGNEDRTAAAAILEREDEMEKSLTQQRAPVYNFTSPQKMRAPIAPPTTTRRYYVQKSTVAGGQQIRLQDQRQMARPYPTAQQIQSQRMVAGGGAGSGPVKYYVPQGGQQQQPYQTVGQAVGAPKYIQRVRPQPPPQQQRVVYSSSGIPTNLAPGQRIVTQRIVTPGGPHPPGTIVRKVIRKIVVNNPAGGATPKQSPAQQVIQRKMMEQDMMERKPEGPPMTSAQAAASLIQHPPQEEYDYF